MSTGAGGSPTRCDWAGSDPAMVEYHDTEWGVPVHDDPTHFESLRARRLRRPD